MQFYQDYNNYYNFFCGTDITTIPTVMDFNLTNPLYSYNHITRKNQLIQIIDKILPIIANQPTSPNSTLHNNNEKPSISHHNTINTQNLFNMSVPSILLALHFNLQIPIDYFIKCFRFGADFSLPCPFTNSLPSITSFSLQHNLLFRTPIRAQLDGLSIDGIHSYDPLLGSIPIINYNNQTNNSSDLPYFSLFQYILFECAFNYRDTAIPFLSILSKHEKNVHLTLPPLSSIDLNPIPFTLKHQSTDDIISTVLLPFLQQCTNKSILTQILNQPIPTTHLLISYQPILDTSPRYIDLEYEYRHNTPYTDFKSHIIRNFADNIQHCYLPSWFFLIKPHNVHPKLLSLCLDYGMRMVYNIGNFEQQNNNNVQNKDYFSGVFNQEIFSILHNHSNIDPPCWYPQQPQPQTTSIKNDKTDTHNTKNGQDDVLSSRQSKRDYLSKSNKQSESYNTNNWSMNLLSYAMFTKKSKSILTLLLNSFQDQIKSNPSHFFMNPKAVTSLNGNQPHSIISFLDSNQYADLFLANFSLQRFFHILYQQYDTIQIKGENCYIPNSWNRYNSRPGGSFPFYPLTIFLSLYSWNYTVVPSRQQLLPIQHRQLLASFFADTQLPSHDYQTSLSVFNKLDEFFHHMNFHSFLTTTLKTPTMLHSLDSHLYTAELVDTSIKTSLARMDVFRYGYKVSSFEQPTHLPPPQAQYGQLQQNLQIVHDLLQAQHKLHLLSLEPNHNSHQTKKNNSKTNAITHQSNDTKSNGKSTKSVSKNQPATKSANTVYTMKNGHAIDLDDLDGDYDDDEYYPEDEFDEDEDFYDNQDDWKE
jgi:hypothetical protein